MSADQNQSRSREAGAALVTVMVGLAVLGVVATTLIVSSMDVAIEGNLALRDAMLVAFDDAVSQYVTHSLAIDRYPHALRVDGVSQDRAILNIDVNISVCSDFGRVDLNSADLQSLTRLFEAAGLGAADAHRDALLVDDWRHPALGIRRDFRSVDELRVVPGPDGTLFRAIKGSVTVYSGRGQVDRGTADYLALQTIPDVDHQAAAAIVRDRVSNYGSDQLSPLIEGQLGPGVSPTGWAFNIVARFRLDGQRIVLQQDIRVTGDPSRPAAVLGESVND